VLNVDVRFICKDTIEEKIVALQKRKSALAANVLTGYDLTLPAHSLLFVHLSGQLLGDWTPSVWRQDIMKCGICRE